MSSSRALVEALVAPLIIPAYFLVIGVAKGQSATNSLVIFIPIILFSYLGTFCWGLPAVSFLKRIGYINLPALAATGAFAGIVVWFFATQWLIWMLDSTANFSRSDAAWGAAMGFAVAVIYGFISGVTQSNETLHDT